MPFYGRIGFVMALRKPLRSKGESCDLSYPLKGVIVTAFGPPIPKIPDSNQEIDKHGGILVIRCMLNGRGGWRLRY